MLYISHLNIWFSFDSPELVDDHMNSNLKEKKKTRKQSSSIRKCAIQISHINGNITFNLLQMNTISNCILNFCMFWQMIRTNLTWKIDFPLLTQKGSPFKFNEDTHIQKLEFSTTDRPTDRNKIDWTQKSISNQKNSIENHWSMLRYKKLHRYLHLFLLKSINNQMWGKKKLSTVMKKEGA